MSIDPFAASRGVLLRAEALLAEIRQVRAVLEASHDLSEAMLPERTVYLTMLTPSSAACSPRWLPWWPTCACCRAATAKRRRGCAVGWTNSGAEPRLVDRAPPSAFIDLGTKVQYDSGATGGTLRFVDHDVLRIGDAVQLRDPSVDAVGTVVQLPARRPDRTWGGPGVGGPCAVCNKPVTKDQLEFEIEFDRDGDNPGLDKFHIHIQCFAAVEFERPHA